MAAKAATFSLSQQSEHLIFCKLAIGNLKTNELSRKIYLLEDAPSGRVMNFS